MSAQPDSRCHAPHKNMIQLMGSRGHQQNMRSRTCRQRIAGQAFRHREPAKGNRATTVNRAAVVRMFPAARPLSRTPVASHQAPKQPSNGHQQTSGGRPLSGPVATAPLAIHNHKAIFGWAANLFLAAATSQTTTAEKSGPARLGDPVPGRGDVEGTAGCAPSRTPSPCRPLPTSHIPPGSGPGLLCPAWCGVPSPSQHRQALAGQSLFICIIPLCQPLYALHLPSYSLIPSLSTSLTTSQ